VHASQLRTPVRAFSPDDPPHHRLANHQASPAGRSLHALDKARPHGCRNAGWHSGEPVITYNDEVTGSRPVTPTIPRQFTAFLQPTGGSRTRPPRADLEAFIANLLDRWLPATAATRYQQLQALYR
jgi:hypothetical protein